MSINFEDVKVGDRIKTREVYKNGDTFEGEVTVTDVNTACVYSEYRWFPKAHSDRESLTIERVQMSEPEKVGTVVEYTRDGVTRTAVKYSNDPVVEYPWIREDGYRLSWSEILEADPDPKIDRLIASAYAEHINETN